MDITPGGSVVSWGPYHALMVKLARGWTDYLFANRGPGRYGDWEPLQKEINRLKNERVDAINFVVNRGPGPQTKPKEKQMHIPKLERALLSLERAGIKLTREQVGLIEQKAKKEVAVTKRDLAKFKKVCQEIHGTESD